MNSAAYNPPDHSSNQLAAFYTAGFLAIVFGMLTGYHFQTFTETGLTQLAYLGGISALSFLMSLVALYQIYHQRFQIGASIVVVISLVVPLTHTLYLEGGVLLMALGTVTVTTLMTTFSSPSRLATQSMLAGGICMLLILGIDRVLPDRMPWILPEPVHQAYPFALGLLCLFFCGFIARYFSRYSIRTKLFILLLVPALVPVGYAVYLTEFSKANSNPFIVLVIGLMLLIVYLGSQLIAFPIQRLARNTLVASQVPNPLPLTTPSPDEIGQLGKAINRLILQLSQTRDALEDKISSRTQLLDRRARQLKTAAKVAQEAASIHDIHTLLHQTTLRVSESFNFYHCGIFLVDENSEYAILQAASSEGGKVMLARGHKLRVGKEGIVGYVTGTGKPRIVLDVGEDAVFFDNPDLPKTRSEMALPLIVKDQIIGALDVQSTKEAAFSSEDIETLQILADQIALALDNARLFEERRLAMQELESLYRKQVHQAWRSKLKNQPITFRYNRVGVERVSAANGQLVGSNPDTADTPSDKGEMMAAIHFRGQRIGSVVLRRDSPETPWKKSERQLIQQVVHQLGLALENARLVEETQLRAANERALSQMSTQLSQSLDIDSLLRTAVEELGRLPQVGEVSVRLSPTSQITRDDA